MTGLYSQRYAEIRKILTPEEVKSLTNIVKAADYRIQELDENEQNEESYRLWRDTTLLATIVGYDPVVDAMLSEEELKKRDKVSEQAGTAKPINIGSTFAILDVKKNRKLLEKSLEGVPSFGACPESMRIPVAIKGYVSGVWGSDDGKSQEFTVDIEEIKLGVQGTTLEMMKDET